MRIVPAERVVLHEETDPVRTARLTELLRQDGILKNPPIVAPLVPDERFVVLDGANRVTSLLALGLPHLLVQVVEYASVQLDTWNHLVTGMNRDQLIGALNVVPGLQVEPDSLRQARALLTARRILGYLIDPDENVLLLRGGQGLREEARLLTAVVRAYKGTGHIFRLKADAIADHSRYYEDIVALVVFPTFTPADIIGLAVVDARLPTGITRHVIPGRALRVNYDLAELARAATGEEKYRTLAAFIQQKLLHREIRFYQESTFLFDE